jgi:ferric iron reductase protein FhuF
VSETAQALRRLEDFRLVLEENDDPLSVKAGQLLLPGEMEIYLNRLAKELDAPIPAAGSLFIKRYSFLAVIYLYSLTAGNCRLDISLPNITVVSAYKNGMWLPGFYLKNTGSVQTESDPRENGREDCFRAMLSEHMHILLERVSKAAGVSRYILWENIAVYIYWLYESVLADEHDGVKARGADDFACLLGLPGNFFGMKDNPLKKYHSPEKGARMRKTCCLSNLIDDSMRCTTCPKSCRLSERGV